MLFPFEGKMPALSPSVRMAENATLVGHVIAGANANFWYGAVVRGDESTISIGENTNIQDNAVLHSGPAAPLVVGDNVTVGHAAILHGCTVEDGCLIGMGAVLLNKCVIGTGCTVAAGTLVTQGTIIPPGSMVMGAPGKVVRPLRLDEFSGIRASAAEYVRLAAKQLPTVGHQEE